MSEIESADMTEIETVIEVGASSKQRSFILRETKSRANIFDVISRIVNLIFEHYLKIDTELLSNSEVRGFLKEFLRSNDQDGDKENVDIVLSNMNTDSTGQIDKYNLAVFFLKLGAYELLVN